MRRRVVLVTTIPCRSPWRHLARTVGSRLNVQRRSELSPSSFAVPPRTAWMRGDMDRSLALTPHARGFTLMNPFGGGAGPL